MRDSQGPTRAVTCTCGQVALAATGRPIFTAACHCRSCRTAGERLETLPGAPPIVATDGGTELVLWRKDRVRCLRGAELLREFRLKPESKTRRVVAVCCNSAMFLDFTAGHWLSLYRQRFAPSDRLPVALRVMTKDRREGVEFTDSLPGYAAQTGRFMWPLFLAWAAMGFRTPQVDFVKGGALDA